MQEKNGNSLQNVFPQFLLMVLFLPPSLLLLPLYVTERMEVLEVFKKPKKFHAAAVKEHVDNEGNEVRGLK